MNFFERQHAARGTTLRLVLLFALAVLGIVVAIDVVVLLLARQQPAGTLVGYLIAATAVSLLIIAGGTVSKTLALRAGGSAVALSVGAVAVDPTTTDPQLRRYVNIVEEMSLASGVPMPRLFVLEREAGINAFAAGHSPADAAVTVTGGALQQLNRDELQGVIGHEFSHILNGDMRLNLRLIGLLNGILLLGLIGLRILAFGGGRGSRRDNNGAAPVLVLALALMALGFIGQFFAGLIKAAVSRQREWLADASAVQFTRQTTGLEGALKKIAAVPDGSQLADARSAQELSHMLFGEGGRSLSQLFATHPPLLKRIAALDPAFRPDDLEPLAQRWQAAPPNGLAEDQRLGLVGGTTASVPTQPPPALGSGVPTSPAQVSARVGTLTPADLARGAELSSQLDDGLRRLAGQASTAVPLVLALLVNGEDRVRDAQLRMIATALGEPTAEAAQRLVATVGSLPPQLRLPLAAIAVPLVAARPQPQLRALTATLDQLAAADGTISLFEYCLTRLVAGYVHDTLSPARRSTPGRADARQERDAAVTLLAALAAVGNDEPAAAARAFGAGVALLLPDATIAYRPPADTRQELDAAWPRLDALQPRHKQRLVEAMVAAVRDDGVLTLHEAELLRTACALLHCPLPSFVA